MFVQVIEGRCHDRDGARRLMDRWVEELAPGAGGWLGTTAGVTDDGDLVAAARFESADAARRNSDRSEQGAWWQEFAKVFDDDPKFLNCDEAELFDGGGSDDAGFVQVIRSRIADHSAWQAVNDRMRALTASDMGRDDIVGGFTGRDGDELVDVIYFTDEASARRGEQMEQPAEVRATMEEWVAALADVRYLDLRDPWLTSP